MTDHLPTRPAWDCLSCGKPWPCEQARVKLLHEFTRYPTVLRIYLQGWKADARADIPELEEQALHDRFLAWSR